MEPLQCSQSHGSPEAWGRAQIYVGPSFRLVRRKGQAGHGPRAGGATGLLAHIWCTVLLCLPRSFRIAADEELDLLLCEGDFSK